MVHARMVKQEEEEGTKEDLELNAITARKNNADAKCRIRSDASFVAALLKLKKSRAI